MTSSIALKDEDSLHTIDRSQYSGRPAAAWFSRHGRAVLRWHPLRVVDRVQEVRGSSPWSRTQEGSRALPPHALRRVPWDTQIIAPYPALLPGLNAGASAPEVIR